MDRDRRRARPTSQVRPTLPPKSELIADRIRATLWPLGRRAGRTCATAVADLSWLLSRGYAVVSALKLAGDRWRLTERQRQAVRRAACSDQARERRRAHQVAPADLSGQVLLIDGFNVLTTIEAALGGAVVLVCRDQTCRDIAGLHGSYRKVAETEPRSPHSPPYWLSSASARPAGCSTGRSQTAEGFAAWSSRPPPRSRRTGPFNWRITRTPSWSDPATSWPRPTARSSTAARSGSTSHGT